MVAIALVVALSLGLGQRNSTSGLAAQAASSAPIDVALSNGKPTMMEFYADWCGSCQAMAPNLAEIKSQFADRVNFSMLNVDNNKWLPEVTRYRVDGIPHFVFFDRQGKVVAQSIGEQPRSILETQLTELFAGKALSILSRPGEVSQFAPKAIPADAGTDPRAHGA